MKVLAPHLLRISLNPDPETTLTTELVVSERDQVTDITKSSMVKPIATSIGKNSMYQSTKEDSGTIMILMAMIKRIGGR